MHGVINQTSRTAATDDDGVDHIGFDTPRSGVATPQPDPQDKRLPGIMSYFAQVRQYPITKDLPVTSSQPEGCKPPGQGRDESTSSFPFIDLLKSQAHNQGSSLPVPDLSTSARVLLHDELHGLQSGAGRVERSVPDPYPTPPASQPPSSGGSLLLGMAAEADGGVVAASPDVSSPPEPKLSGVSHFTTTHYESPDESLPSLLSPPKATALPEKPSCVTARSESSTATRPPPGKWYSLEGLKELTRAMTFKSGPSTPTRAMSAARPSMSDGRNNSARTSNDGADASGTQTPRTGGVQPPAPKGKLTIKISEARGLRKSRDPYVVVVFQRSELISGGPHNVEDEKKLSVAIPGMGGVPIQRQGSDSGRPMAIPMRSRQSSNTSISDYNTFRSRNSRASFTNPKWDAEAAL